MLLFLYLSAMYALCDFILLGIEQLDMKAEVHYVEAADDPSLQSIKFNYNISSVLPGYNTISLTINVTQAITR